MTTKRAYEYNVYLDSHGNPTTNLAPLGEAGRQKQPRKKTPCEDTTGMITQGKVVDTKGKGRKLLLKV